MSSTQSQLIGKKDERKVRPGSERNRALTGPCVTLRAMYFHMRNCSGWFSHHGTDYLVRLLAMICFPKSYAACERVFRRAEAVRAN